MAYDTLVDKNQLEKGLKATADAIRAKSNKTEVIPWNMTTGFADAMEDLTTEEIIKPIEIPDYVRTEAQRVATEVRKVLKSDSIVSIKISDSHFAGDMAGTSSDWLQTNTSCVHACMAIKALTYLLPVDYIAHLGDVGKGTVQENNENHKKQIKDFLKYFLDSVGKAPVFVAIGNHDSGIYYHSGQSSGVHVLSGEWLYENFTAHSASDNTVFAGEESGGYCYRDFEDKKLRVIMLNTSEDLITTYDKNSDNGCLEGQQLWAAQALQNLNTKADAAQWGFVVLSHYPLDYGDACRISNVFMAYVNGESITLNGTTVNFNGKNAAKFYAQFHGHAHCFAYDSLHGFKIFGTMIPYGVWRLCTPNACYNSENNYKDKTYYGLSFGEETSYPKTINSGKDTSFVVDVINPSEQTLYSFCYGAGYDRAVSLEGKVYYSVKKELTYASLSGESGTVIEEGKSYSSVITVGKGGTLKSVLITMGGVDITSSAYNANTGTINIANVTGDIVITVVAIEPPKNWIPLSVTTDGTTIFGADYNGDGVADGYLKDYYISASTGNETAGSGFYCTGYIPVSTTDKVVIMGVDWSVHNYTNSRLILYSRTTGGALLAQITSPVVDSNGNVVITPDMWHASTAYFRISCAGIDENSAVYKNIEYVSPSYTVTNTLTNVTTSNNASSVTGGASYSATLTAKSGYTISTVKVTMGGTDITSSVYNNGAISISSVTGNIVITATATETVVEPTYTNLLPTAQVFANGDTSALDGKGYRDGYYQSSSGGVGSAASGYTCTGLIPYARKSDGTFPTIYIKGCEWDATSRSRLYYYSSTKSQLNSSSYGGTATNGNVEKWQTITKLGDKYYSFDSNSTMDSAIQQPAYFAFSLKGSGADLIITLDEPIV